MRYLGSSNFTGWQVAEAEWTARTRHLERFVSAQNEYSWLDRDVEADLIPALEHYGIGLLPYLGLPIYRSHLVPLDALPRLLRTADVHLITLRDPFVGYVLPSKTHACIASGKRILFVGSENSDVHLLANEALQSGMYWHVNVGDVGRLESALHAIEEFGYCGTSAASASQNSWDEPVGVGMCGIAGAFSFDLSGHPVDKATVVELNQLQRRRGPDGEGLWVSNDEQVVFGHRRLAIIDPGPDGNQPMSDVSGRWTITFNGEIYNYRVLRRELEQQGRVLRTDSDTEVLINVIAQWGEAGLRKLRGMYAFALWDNAERELWLVRDPYGIKPLYVSEHDGILWFASQARALAQGAPVKTNRDPAALCGFYLWGHVPEPFTWWAGIYLLPAGHVQRVRAGKPMSSARSFAKIEDAYVRHPPRMLQKGELRSLVRDSVCHHLVADVPVGVFLSGGVDSSVIAALAAETTSSLQTVTLAFEEFRDTKNDEAARAEETARRLGTKHTTFRMGRAEFEGLFDDFMNCMDQPTIDGLNVYLVSYAAAKLGLKVALSGLGGDEVFGGYPSFRRLPALTKWGRQLSLWQPVLIALEKALRTIASPGVHPKTSRVFSHWGSLPKAYFLLRGLYLVDELDWLLDESWIREGIERLATEAALRVRLRLFDKSARPSTCRLLH